MPNTLFGNQGAFDPHLLPAAEESSRDTGGRRVREAWIRWAQTQPNQKPSWLLPYDELAEADKEADRQIYDAIVCDTGGGCTLAGPGRGDCFHSIGLPIAEDATTTDCYGKPHGWCWACWKSELLQRAEARYTQALIDADARYPTEWAYEQVCKARDDWQERAVRAERVALDLFLLMGNEAAANLPNVRQHENSAEFMEYLGEIYQRCLTLVMRADVLDVLARAAKNNPILHVYTNDIDTFIAASLADLWVLYRETIGDTIDDDERQAWHLIAPEHEITVQFPDDDPPHTDTATAAEWVQRHGRGFLCSTEY